MVSLTRTAKGVKTEYHQCCFLPIYFYHKLLLKFHTLLKFVLRLELHFKSSFSKMRKTAWATKQSPINCSLLIVPVDGFYLLNTHNSHHWASKLGSLRENTCKLWWLLDSNTWQFHASFCQTQFLSYCSESGKMGIEDWMKMIKHWPKNLTVYLAIQ